MADITSLFPRQTIEAAENGDLEPLLERLRASDLNAEESEWIERRLKGDPSAKMRAGPPVPPRCLGAPMTTVAPAAGTLSRLAMHSIPNRPVGSQA